MDPFEEFEFKPLTDGLGFHKKKAATAKFETEADSFSASPSPALLKNQGLELIEENSVDPLRPPLPRKKSSPATSPVPSAPGYLTEVGGEANPASSTAAVDEILKTLQKNRRLEFDEKSKTKITAQTKEEYKSTVFSFSAGLLDGMLVMAASLLCLILLVSIARIDLVANLTQPDENYFVYLAIVSIFACVSFVYLSLNRIFMGATPGEWAFDQRVGTPADLVSGMFCLKVAARSALVIATGFIVFPILSALMNKDYAGQITGARLLKKV
ncbi:metalloendopeptidase [Bdellovibrio sp. KM01]|uniref:metalloendopeptidase n=1 Tax=Bdellovibrio sp. KM01 TaxID=2748865 RepID=UPI0015E989F8|nr:metalloendopeptidase [Bdellovibrio sp. KM01]QLY26012.1 metalloendopeptidase [Bdellovibrio sp. KM01]